MLTALAVFSTLSGNLLLTGSLANIIVAERAAAHGVRVTFGDFAKVGISTATLSIGFAAVIVLPQRLSEMIDGTITA